MNKTIISSFALAALIAAGSPSTAAAAEDSFLFGAPQRGQVFGSLGYSGTPRIGYMTGLNPTTAIGGEFILDIGQFYNTQSFVPGNRIFVGAAVPIKLLLSEEDKLTFALTVAPGIGAQIITGGATQFGILMHGAVNVGYKASKQFTIGGGIDVPLSLHFGDFTNVAIPILLGPAAEFRVTRDLTLRSELKLGPHITAADFGGGANLGLKFNIGVNYAF